MGEIDRFISAMLKISEEIKAIEAGQIKVEDSPLRNAPHTAESLVSEQWNKSYSREQAAFPAGTQIGLARRGKYWPTAARIDGAYGDRNLVCACEPIEALAIQLSFH